MFDEIGNELVAFESTTGSTHLIYEHDGKVCHGEKLPNFKYVTTDGINVNPNPKSLFYHEKLLETFTANLCTTINQQQFDKLECLFNMANRKSLKMDDRFLPKVGDENAKKKFLHKIHIYLLYFKHMDKIIKTQLEKSTETNTFDVITEELRTLLNSLEEFSHEEEKNVKFLHYNIVVEKILKSTEELLKIFNHLEESDLPDTLRATIQPSYNYYIASVLGLIDEGANFLEENDYYSYENWILEFLSRKEQILPICSSWKEAFEKLGFTSVKSEILGKMADPRDTFCHDFPGQYASRFVVQEYKYNILLTSWNTNDERRSKWNSDKVIDIYYTIPVEVSEEMRFVKAIDRFKIDDTELNQKQYYQQYILQEQTPLQNVSFWFHGTDHKSASDIVRLGINVGKGRTGLDFSSGIGFYMTR